MTKKILLLGSGFVAAPALSYLLRRPENFVTIASANLKNAEALREKCPKEQTKAIAINVEDPDALDAQVKEHDLIISLIPWTFHVLVIKSAIKFKKNVVTTSYVNPFMRELDQQAKDAGITVMNEIGVDPGIDHLYALKMIDKVKAEGGELESFISYCGGLPAPENSNNPLGYKFSWSPVGVLLALKSMGRHLENGKEITVEGVELLKSARPIFTYPAFAVEGYPNRDSLPFIQYYNVPEVKTFIRGSLRFQGNPRFMQTIVECGFLNRDPQDFLQASAPPVSWKTVFAKLLGCNPSSEEIEKAVVQKSGIQGEEKERIIRGMKWLGLFSDQDAPKAGTYLDTLAKTLFSKMQYQPGERDMILLQHKFDVKYKDGRKQHITSTMIEYGEPNGTTAMAKTVGIPCGIAAQLVLDGKITQKGVFAPYSLDVIDQIIPLLEKEGIKVVDEVIDL